MDLEDISFGDFTKHLAARLVVDGIGIPHTPYRREWHESFYDLKKAEGNKPRFIGSMQFDWDAPFPKSPELSEYLQAVIVYGIDAKLILTQEDAFSQELRDYLAASAKRIKALLN